jgi:hypothetical protein
VGLRQYVLQATAVNKISNHFLYCIVRDRKYILQSYSSLVEELSVCLVGRVHHYGVGDLDQEGQYHHLRYQHQEQVEPHDHWDIKDLPSIANCNTDVNKDEFIFFCEQI